MSPEDGNEVDRISERLAAIKARINEEQRWHKQQRKAGALGLLAGFIVVVPAVLVLSGALSFSRPREPQDIGQRINELTVLINASARAISDIEKEIVARRELVRQLEKDAQRAKQLSAVSKEQAEAVAQALEIELEKKERGGFWFSQLLSLLYVLLGVVGTEVYHWVRRRYLSKAALR